MLDTQTKKKTVNLIQKITSLVFIDDFINDSLKEDVKKLAEEIKKPEPLPGWEDFLKNETKSLSEMVDKMIDETEQHLSNLEHSNIADELKSYPFHLIYPNHKRKIIEKLNYIIRNSNYEITVSERDMIAERVINILLEQLEERLENWKISS